MNCTLVRERLSAYHDRELPPVQTADVQGHWKRCDECRRILTGYRKLSILAARLTDAVPPPGRWTTIERKLGASSHEPQSERAPTWPRQTRSRAIAAIAALVLMAAGVGFMSYRLLNPDAAHRAEVAENFRQYLDTYQSDHQLAQETLLASYRGRAVDLAEATRQVGYEPIAAANLPAGYTVDGIYVMDMPCCTCAQIVCKRADGRVITIFEHDKDQPAWFGDRPSIEACVCDTPTKMVQVGSMLAMTWKKGERHLTVIGAQDVEEATHLLSTMGNGAAAT